MKDKQIIILIVLLNCIALVLLFISYIQSTKSKNTENKYYKRIIINKRYQDSFGKELPKGICNFYIINNSNYFQDSCKSYYIGDTIGITKIRK